MSTSVLMVFVDGLGMPPAPPSRTPVCPDVCPALCRLLDDDAVAIDACMGVEGLPQSATGQTAILTGVNAAAEMGGHREGFPGQALRQIIVRENIFRKLRQAGCACTFANGYLAKTRESVQALRLKSVTTVAALSALEEVRQYEHLLARDAVAHDLTRETLFARGYRGPVLQPEDAAEDLATLAANHDFTLFEFFLTDHAGHRGDFQTACRILSRFDRFLQELVSRTARAGMLLVLTSDHGNIEDVSTRGHTRNLVPFIASGPGGAALRERIRDLTDITPALTAFITGGRRRVPDDQNS